MRPFDIQGGLSFPALTRIGPRQTRASVLVDDSETRRGCNPEFRIESGQIGSNVWVIVGVDDCDRLAAAICRRCTEQSVVKPVRRANLRGGVTTDRRAGVRNQVIIRLETAGREKLSRLENFHSELPADSNCLATAAMARRDTLRLFFSEHNGASGIHRLLGFTRPRNLLWPEGTTCLSTAPWRFVLRVHPFAKGRE